MGVYYFYVNDTKKQFFCVDPSLQDIKWYAVGRNIGSRALSYLLLNYDAQHAVFEPHPLIGSWIGDSISITGDDYDPRFNEIEAEYEDIGQKVFEMVITARPSDLYEYGGFDWLTWLLEHDGSPIVLTPELRKRLSQEFSTLNEHNPCVRLTRVIQACEKVPVAETS
jgi:hypothetical protein